MRFPVPFNTHYPTVPGEQFSVSASVQRDCTLARIIVSSATPSGEYILHSLVIEETNALAYPASVKDIEEFANAGHLSFSVTAGTVVRLDVTWHPPRRPVIITKRQAKLRKFQGAWWVTTKQRPRDMFQAALLVESEPSQ